MPELLVAVVHVHATGVRAWLAPTDSPGAFLRSSARPRSAGLPTDVRAVLRDLDALGLGSQLLALAVAVDANDTASLLAELGDELPEGWGLPASLPVVVGRARAWAEQGASVPQPLVAGAVVSAARAVGAHAHLPRPQAGGDRADGD